MIYAFHNENVPFDVPLFHTPSIDTRTHKERNGERGSCAHIHWINLMCAKRDSSERVPWVKAKAKAKTNSNRHKLKSNLVSELMNYFFKRVSNKMQISNAVIFNWTFVRTALHISNEMGCKQPQQILKILLTLLFQVQTRAICRSRGGRRYR